MKFNKTFYCPIIKSETSKDGDFITVGGIASSSIIDSDGEIITTEAMRKAREDYLKFAAIREMHQSIAAGKCIKFEILENGDTYIEAEIYDKETIKKVRAGILKAFSICGKAIKKIGNTIVEIILAEISLVDRPANPNSIMTFFKADMNNNNDNKEENNMPKEVKKEEEKEVKDKEEDSLTNDIENDKLEEDNIDVEKQKESDILKEDSNKIKLIYDMLLNVCSKFESNLEVNKTESVDLVKFANKEQELNNEIIELKKSVNLLNLKIVELENMPEDNKIIKSEFKQDSEVEPVYVNGKIDEAATLIKKSFGNFFK